MHFEILVEDKSGKLALENILPKIIGTNCTSKVHAYKGIGHIPKGMTANQDPKKRQLLNQLPKLLNGYGKTFQAWPENYQAFVILVCDLDNRNCEDFLNELNLILERCAVKPNTYFCLCIEEGEAWLLGDKEAVKKAFPNAKKAILDSYVEDSICGTWETLADAVYSGGAEALSKQGWVEIGRQKSEWAKNISPLVDVAQNKSPSFQFFKSTLDKICNDSNV